MKKYLKKIMPSFLQINARKLSHNIVKWFYFLFKDKVLLVNYLAPTFGLFSPNQYNWGDDLNYSFVKKMTSLFVIHINFIPNATKNKTYSVIGSVIPWILNRNSIVWGCGNMLPEMKIEHENIPSKIYAVRGPRTRQYLLNQNIECPPIYGDPALLLPILYTPRKTKHYKIGIILHQADKISKNALFWFEKLKDEYIDIDLTKYREWTDVIDKIYNCDLVISSSLHGLIVADAYNIPNVWVEFEYQHTGNYFKFFDYFESVGRIEKMPVKWNDSFDFSNLLNEVKANPKPEIDILPLIESCPFQNNLKSKYLRFMSNKKIVKKSIYKHII